MDQQRRQPNQAGAQRDWQALLALAEEARKTLGDLVPTDAAEIRSIKADAKLKPIFGKDQVSMFEMAGLIGKHVQ